MISEKGGYNDLILDELRSTTNDTNIQHIINISHFSY